MVLIVHRFSEVAACTVRTYEYSVIKPRCPSALLKKQHQRRPLSYFLSPDPSVGEPMSLEWLSSSLNNYRELWYEFPGSSANQSHKKREVDEREVDVQTL